MDKSFKNLSLTTLIFISIVIFFYRINNVDRRETSWDVLGYYLYLPSTFIHHDLFLKDISWLKVLNEKQQLTGTLYQISNNKKGEPMYFFLMGMALFYLPFFLMANIYASNFNYPVDGFSLPYQYFLVIGGILYTIIGLIYLRKILKYFFSEGVTTLVIIITVFGTNYIHHLTLKNLETVNLLFMLVCIIVWNTIKWHESQKMKFLIPIGICTTLMALIKPSEIIIFLIPVFWNIYSSKSVLQKYSLVINNLTGIIITLIFCFLLILPQMLYWHANVGKYIYNSYNNPGVGLDFLSPHIIDILFSYRKGWLLYTPVMFFSLTGFYFLFKENRKIFTAILIYFIVAFYIIASWTEWWYGAAFSTRPLITTYPLLAICLGYFIKHAQKQHLYFKSVIILIVLFCIFLNQFQWWQLKHFILDPYRTTKDYYWATFLKTSVDEKDKELLRVNRDFTGKVNFEHRDKYIESDLINLTFEGQSNDNINKDSDGNNFFRIKPDQEFALTDERKFNELTSKDHAFILAGFQVRFNEKPTNEFPLFVMTMEHNKWSYGYLTKEIKPDSINNKWYKFDMIYLTPEIRNGNDNFKCYIWHRGKTKFDIDNFKIERFEPGKL